MTIRLFGHYAVSSRQRALRSLGVRPIASAVMCGYRRIAAGCRQSLHVPLHLQLLSSTTSNAYQRGHSGNQNATTDYAHKDEKRDRNEIHSEPPRGPAASPGSPF